MDVKKRHLKKKDPQFELFFDMKLPAEVDWLVIFLADENVIFNGWFDHRQNEFNSMKIWSTCNHSKILNQPVGLQKIR